MSTTNGDTLRPPSTSSGRGFGKAQGAQSSGCTQFFIFQDENHWRIASADARLSEFSGLYPCLDTAISLLQEAGVTYRVIRFGDTPEADKDNGWIAEVEEQITMDLAA